MGKKFQDRLIVWAGKLSQNTVLTVISRSFMMIFPFMMIGSIFSLITGVQISAWQSFLTNSGLMPVLSIPVQYTTEFISIYLAYAIAYNYCVKKGNKKQAVTTGLISIFAFLCLIPYQIAGEDWEAVTVIPFTYLGSKGMFVAIIAAFTVAIVVTTAVKHKWTIKMPESVPPFVTNAFSSLIPAFAVTIVFLIIRFIFSYTPWGDAVNALYTLLQKPMNVVTTGPWGVAIIETISMTLWWLGIHGGSVTYSTKNILFADARLGNLAAYSAGQPLTNIVTGLFLTPGVLPLIAIILVFCKSKRARSVAKIAAIPAVFGISEPINFGLPTVMNPLLAIPSIVIYPISVFFTYLLNLSGLLAYCNGVQIRNCPYFILAFIQFGGLVGLIWWIVLFIVSCLIYYPFVKAMDKRYIMDEQGEEL